MIIEDIQFTQSNHLNGTPSAHEPSVSSTDANFFNSLLAPSSLFNKETSHTGSRNALFEASDKLNSVTKDMTKSLRALSDRERYDEARKYPGQLSEAALLTHILVKSVGKSAQCLDKICNLQ